MRRIAAVSSEDDYQHPQFSMGGAQQPWPGGQTGSREPGQQWYPLGAQ